MLRNACHHDRRGALADLSAGYHQFEMRWLDVLASGFKTMIHGCGEARLRALRAQIDALLHVGVQQIHR
jgi:hypothetical protein